MLLLLREREEKKKKDKNEKAEFREDSKLKIKFKSNKFLTHPENLPQTIPDFVIDRLVALAALKMQ